MDGTKKFSHTKKKDNTSPNTGEDPGGAPQDRPSMGEGTPSQSSSSSTLSTSDPLPSSSSSSTSQSAPSSSSSPSPCAALLQVGDSVELRVVAVGASSEALAVHVEGVPSINVIPHITIAHAPAAKPVASNTIDTWYPLDDSSNNEIHVTIPGATPSPLRLDASSLAALRIRGVIKEYVVIGLATPERPPPANTRPLDANGNPISVGNILKKLVPSLEGRTMGEAVKKVQTWMQDNSIQTNEEVEAYVKSTWNVS
eukprot:TRINITY_DN6539_c0_g1_i1.p1 TRINITY_DN6539_c0_g1~~TRINITY_DN6539_c0_g1_i1.p1  ORF type:complete len:277 (+),score=94.25 TRINITY_DN6539_c0_g1_i1:67-831(+)